LEAFLTIQQTIDIPASREVNIHLVVPETVPCGKTDVILGFPEVQKAVDQKTFSDMPTIAELKREAAEKAERRRTDPVYRAEVTKILRELQEGGPIFGGRDGMDVQREMRSEWGD
jgi:hypothetical protein